MSLVLKYKLETTFLKIGSRQAVDNHSLIQHYLCIFLFLDPFICRPFFRLRYTRCLTISNQIYSFHLSKKVTDLKLAWFPFLNSVILETDCRRLSSTRTGFFTKLGFSKIQGTYTALINIHTCTYFNIFDQKKQLQKFDWSAQLPCELQLPKFCRTRTQLRTE